MRKIFISAVVLFSFLTACSSEEKKELQILKEVIRGNDWQIPYVREEFLTIADLSVNHEILKKYFYEKDIEHFLQRDQVNGKNMNLDKGDLKYQDRLSGKEKDTEIFTADADSCNKVIYSFSRPYVTTDRQKMLLLTSSSFSKCDEDRKKSLKTSNVLIFQHKENHWQLIQEEDLATSQSLLKSITNPKK